MTDLDLTGKQLGYLCPEDDCDFEGKTALALGAHRKLKHGTPGKSAGAKKRARPRRPAGSSSASSSPSSSSSGKSVTVKEIATQLDDIAEHLEEKAPRTAAALKHRADSISAAGADLWASTEMGERVIQAAGDEDRERLLRLAVAGAPVVFTAFAELMAPRIFGPLVEMWRSRRRRVITDEAGVEFMVDRKGNIFTMDGTPTGQNLNHLGDQRQPAPAAPAEPAPAAEEPPAEGVGYWPEDAAASAY